MNPTKALQFFREVFAELGKVTWPTRQETLRLTITVVIVSALIAALIGGLDFVLTGFVSKILTI